MTTSILHKCQYLVKDSYKLITPRIIFFLLYYVCNISRYKNMVIEFTDANFDTQVLRVIKLFW